LESIYAMQERKQQQAELLRKVRRDFKSKVQAPAKTSRYAPLGTRTE